VRTEVVRMRTGGVCVRMEVVRIRTGGVCVRTEVVRMRTGWVCVRTEAVRMVPTRPSPCLRRRAPRGRRVSGQFVRQRDLNAVEGGVNGLPKIVMRIDASELGRVEQAIE
jgi:hypothetical protein